MKVAMNEFARRQTKDSPYSYFNGPEDDLIDRILKDFGKQKPGYRDGVILIPITDTHQFFSGVTQVSEDTQLHASLKRRRPEEDPYIAIEALDAEKLPAQYVEIVLYSHETLKENDENSTDADWEIISINARATAEDEPMNPISMARNFLELTGGTKADYSAEEFAKAIIYWSTRATIAPKK